MKNKMVLSKHFKVLYRHMTQYILPPLLSPTPLHHPPPLLSLLLSPVFVYFVYFVGLGVYFK